MPRAIANKWEQVDSAHAHVIVIADRAISFLGRDFLYSDLLMNCSFNYISGYFLFNRFFTLSTFLVALVARFSLCAGIKERHRRRSNFP